MARCYKCVLSFHLGSRQINLIPIRFLVAGVASRNKGQMTRQLPKPPKKMMIEKRLRQKTDVHRKPPETLDEILQWASMNLRMLAAVAPSMYRRVVRATIPGMGGKPLGVWTDYSGIGGPELALMEIMAALREFGHEPDVYFHRARDMEPVCRQVLLAEVPPNGAAHVFETIEGELPAAVRHRLKTLSRRCQRAVSSCSTLTAKDRQRQLQNIGQGFVRGLADIASDVSFPWDRQQYCHRCQRRCPVAFPDKEDRLGRRWMAVAGLTCTDFHPLVHTKGRLACHRWH